MEKIAVEIMGLHLYEPVTYLSDLILAGFSIFWFTRLRKEGDQDTMSNSFSRYFLFMGIGPFISGHAHLFDHYIHHNYFHVIGWSLAAFGTYNFQKGCAMDFSVDLKNRINWIIKALLVSSILFYFAYQFLVDVDTEKTTVGVPGFMAVSIFTAVGYLAFLVPMNYVKFTKEKDAGSGLILLGIVMTAGTLVLHSKKFSLSPHINYNVLAHIVLIICYYMYFLGMRKKIRGYEETD